jgi:hypothetical protein
MEAPPCNICSEQHYRERVGMSFLAVFFTVFFFVAIVLGPIFGAEDRPDFLRPDSKFRKMVTPLRRR